MLGLLLVLVVKDFRQPIVLYLRHAFPREYKIVQEAWANLLQLWGFVLNWGELQL
jgi:hypothetical protein